MKKTVFQKLLIGCLLLLPMISMAQDTDKMGIVPVFNYNSNQVLFVDADLGEMKSFAVFENPVTSVAVNEKEGVFYAMSRHVLYKADLESGDVLDQVQFMEVLEKQPSDVIDPNLQIIPYGVTEEGYAFYSYNEPYISLMREQQDLLAKMKGASLEEITAISKKIQEISPKMTEYALQQRLFRVDLTSKSPTEYDTYDMQHKLILKLDQRGQLLIHDKDADVIAYLDVASGNKVKELPATAIYTQYPEFKQHEKNVSVIMVSDDLIQYSVYGINGLVGGKYILFNTTTNEVVLVKEFDSPMDGTYPLYYENCKNYVFADKQCSIGPMPPMPDFGQPAGYSKKKIAAWEEEMKKKQTAYQKALNEWQDRATNPENCDIKILEGTDFNNVVMEIPKASYAIVQNDKYCIVNRLHELAMYNLETKELVWSIDTDF